MKIDRIPEKQSGNSGLQTSHKENEDKKAPGDTLESLNETTLGESAARWNLNVTADRVVYTRSQISELLNMISEGNKSAGGLREIGRFFGIVGFIRFTSTYYMVLISKRSIVGLLGGHYIYHCDETRIIPVCPSNVLASVGGRTKALDQEEARLLHTFRQVDLSKNFYFSYTYDLTKTLQENLTSTVANESTAMATTAWGYNEKFIWNHHLLLPAFASSVHLRGSDTASEWVLPLVYGFVDQAKLRVLNCTIQVTLIARRSRHFAGARFLKRGTDEHGHVANDVETEQIVCDALTTPFYAPQRRQREKETTRGPNPRFTSYVMLRGSIPVYWTQDSTNMSPRPPIEISVVDPYYSSAALHFDDLLRRYGHPIVVLNLIKSKEKQPREVKLLHAFDECVKYLNQFLPKEKRLRYIAWDMSRASKSRDQDVIGVLEDIAEETITATNFFHSGHEPTRTGHYHLGENPTSSRKSILLQNGVARVNCVDCLDRTNAAQFVIGKAAFGHQLYALGLLDHPSLPFDSDAIDMLTEMYHDLGDTIALQYGGSHLVNTMETYRKINQWTSHSRDMLEGLKRYYANSFVDAEKQAAINLFLGIDNDAPEFRPVLANRRRNYQHWYTSDFLEPHGTLEEHEAQLQKFAEAASSFWAEYYRPSLFTDLMRHHAFKMTAVHQQTALPAAYTTLSSSPKSLTSPRSTSVPIISSPISKPFRGRLNSISHSVLPNQAETTLSPFKSRVPESPSKASARLQSDEHDSPKQRTAIIGGVRRWISLNRIDQHHQDATPPGATSMKTQNASLNRTEKSDGSSDDDEYQLYRMQSAWPSWEEIIGAQSTAPSTEPLLNGIMAPQVSPEEAKEYASWLDQFRNVAFEGGSVPDVPEPAVLLSATHAGMAIGSVAPRGREIGRSSSAQQQLNLVGPRKPATQKQRQQVAETDARLYDHDAALASGMLLASMSAELTARLSSYQPTELAGHAPLSSNTPNHQLGGLEPTLVNYPLSSEALHAPASDAKVRAYTKWLQGNVDKVPHFNMERV